MNGSPPIATERLRRAAQSKLRTSLLSAPAAAGIKAVGLEPVGEVMGCIVQSSGFAAQPSTLGYAPDYRYVQRAIRHGYHTALDRMYQESAALGADGIVGVALSTSRMDNGAEEYLAMGTAVRAQSSHRPGFVFSTDLAGADLAKLMLAGWVPVRIGVAVALRSNWVSYTAQQQMSAFAGNTEVDTHTTLMAGVRAEAREEFRKQVEAVHADGGIMSDMSLSTWEIGEIGIAAMAMVYGTAIARFRQSRPAPANTLTIMPLRRQGE